MTLPELGVKRPVLSAMIFIGMVIIGLVSLSFLGLDLMPEMEIPSIAVVTFYRGAGPQEVEARVTKPLEEKLSTLSALDKIESASQESLSVIQLKFGWGTNLDERMNDIRDAIEMAKIYIPDEADNPILLKFDISMMPVIIAGVVAQESYPRLLKIVEREIVDPIKRIPGVASVILRGGLTRQIQVNLNQEKLAAHNLTIDRLSQILYAENLSIPGGHLKTDTMDFLVRIPEEFSSVSEIGDIIVSVQNGVPVYLKDIAEIKDSVEEPTEELKVNQQHAVAFMIQKQTGANTVDISRAVLKELEVLKKNLPPDCQLIVVRNFADQILLSIKTLTDSLYYAIILVILVVLLFLRNIRSSLIVAVSIPTSLIITFLLMYLKGYTLNMMSLSSIAIAVGMVVDDAIVVLENIYKHRERGEKMAEASIIGAREVSNAVIAATLTTVSIFFPIIFVGGFTGIMFSQMALVITMALMASLFTALILIPMMTSKFLKPLEVMAEGEKGLIQRVFELSERAFHLVEEQYGKAISWALSHKKTIFFGAFLLLLLSLGMIPLVGTEFFPEEDAGIIQLFIELPVGTRMEVTGEITSAIEKWMAEQTPETVASFSRWGYQKQAFMTAFMGYEEGSNLGTVSLRLTNREERARLAREITEDLRRKMPEFPGAKYRFSSQDPMASMLFGGSALSLEIRGFDLKIASDLAKKVEKMLQTIPGIKDINISRKEGKPEIRINIDRKKAANMGLNVGIIASAIRSAVDGVVVSKYRQGGDEYDIMLRLREEDRKFLKDIENLRITSLIGTQIPLGNVATIVEEEGPTKIERVDQERVIKVTADIVGRDLGSVVSEIKSKLKELSIPEEFHINIAGAREEQEKSFRLLFLALLLSAALVYMVMASQFESLRDPFIIFTSIPFAFIGVIWTFLLLNQRLSILSFVGIIMLEGIVVKNGIVLIDYINLLRRRGLGVNEAVIQGGMNRLRPVLMTAMTTFFGLLPLALTKTEGAESWIAMSTTVMGGLAVSTLITLIFAPTLYAILEGRKGRKITQE